MERALARLREIERELREKPMPEDVCALLAAETGVDLRASYGPFRLKNPILVAPGQMTVNTGQIARIRAAGFAGCVLKSVVGEDPTGVCSMDFQRRKSTFIESVYDPDDADRRRPIIHWNGRMDTRTLAAYEPFAREARELAGERFFIAASLLCHLPGPGESFREAEWTHTARLLSDAGYAAIEVDFCPSLRKESPLIERENILGWYRTTAALVKAAAPGAAVFPKLLNLEYGEDFEVAMARAARDGGADGVVAANRIFKKEYDCAHGGTELRERNLPLVARIKREVPELRISATGGVYSGEHAFRYLAAGAENVQVLSYIMGKVVPPFASAGDKFRQVLHALLLDPDDGLAAAALRSRRG